MVYLFLNFKCKQHTILITFLFSILYCSQNPKVLIFNTTGERDSKKLIEILRQRSDFNFACFVPNLSSGSVNKTDNITSLYAISDQMKRAKLLSGLWHLLCQEANESDDSKVFGSILDSLIFVRQIFGTTQEIDLLVTGSLHLIGATILALDELGRRLDNNFNKLAV